MSLLIKRLCAYLFDVFFIYLLLSLIVSIKFINPTYEKYNEAYTRYTEVVQKYYNKEISIEEMQEQNKDNYYYATKYSVSNILVIELVIFLYFCVFQKYNNGQTLGKKIMKLRVISGNDKDISILRYLLRIIPMYFIFIGGIIPLIINSILVFLLDVNNYTNISSIVTYVFLFIAIFDSTMNFHNKISHTDIELVEK